MMGGSGYWYRVRGVHCVDLDESFQTHIYLQNLASIQPRTSPLKFVGSRDAAAPARDALSLDSSPIDTRLIDEPFGSAAARLTDEPTRLQIKDAG